MNKTISGLIFIVILFASCSKGITTPCKAVITVHEHESGKWQGCIGTDWKTYVKTLDGNVDYVCGKVGTLGDTISGWWTEGHYESTMNGFKLTN